MEDTAPPQPFDIIILGAGINGCGIAAELSRAGFRVLVLEKKTIGSGTSSKSSRLIHGGLRYLETFEFGLVREALKDREELLEKYPHIVSLKPFYLPVYRSSPRRSLTIWTGLKLYDLLAGRRSASHSKRIKRSTFKTIAPMLRQTDLTAVFRYVDGKTNDVLLTREVGADAVKYGAVIHQFVEIDTIDRNEREYKILSNRGIFTAPTLINATGPWIDEVNQQYHFPARYHIRKISGIHVIIDGCLTSELLFMQTAEKRIFFIIPEPENQHTIIGTTEREETGAVDTVQVRPEDVDYLLAQLNNYLCDENQVSPDEIKSSYIGVRPLIAHKENPTDLSREYRLDRHQIGATTLIHVFGGKLTTFLSLARKVRQLIGD